MITRMTRYSIILLDSDLDRFLIGLQDIGMVDITRSTAAIDDYSKEAVSTIARCKEAERKLSGFCRNADPDSCGQATDTPDGNSLLLAIEKAFSERDSISRDIENLSRETETALPWGEFNPEDLDKIKALGLVPHFYTVPEKKFRSDWESTYPIQILNRTGNKVYFIVLSQGGENYSFPVPGEVSFPSLPASALIAETAVKQKQIEALDKEILGYGRHTDSLVRLEEELSAGLDIHFAKSSSIKEGEGTICILEGFAPTEEDANVKEFLDNSPAYYIAEEAKGEDNPPVQLKNNRFSRLFEPIGSLYELPSYDEVDLTPYFAPFYMLFFGFCLGDMGYGLIMLAIGIAVAAALPKFRAYGKLIAWLGIGSIIMPLISGTFFGMKVYDIIPMPENIRGLFFSDLKMFWFSIIFGLFQIVFARLLKASIAFSRKNWDTALTEVGWSLIIVWASCAYAGSQMGTQLLPKAVALPIVITGLVLVLFCSSPSKYFFLRPIKGIASLYDITSIFGDMLSYIRLFGLGTTGGILALVINSIAMSLSGIPYVGWVITVIFLIFGHIAVMGLSCLGAFVHPVRLTFVEFYKNAGFTGGGRAYKPLKSLNNK